MKRKLLLACALALSTAVSPSAIFAQQTDPDRAHWAIYNCASPGPGYEYYGYETFGDCYNDFYRYYPDYPPGLQP